MAQEHMQVGLEGAAPSRDGGATGSVAKDFRLCARLTFDQHKKELVKHYAWVASMDKHYAWWAVDDLACLS